MKNCWCIIVLNILFVCDDAWKWLHCLHVPHFSFALIANIIELKFLKILWVCTIEPSVALTFFFFKHLLRKSKYFLTLFWICGIINLMLIQWNVNITRNSILLREPVIVNWLLLFGCKRIILFNLLLFKHINRFILIISLRNMIWLKIWILNMINKLALRTSTNRALIPLLILITINVGYIQSRHKFVNIFFQNVTLINTLLLITIYWKVTS